MQIASRCWTTDSLQMPCFFSKQGFRCVSYLEFSFPDKPQLVSSLVPQALTFLVNGTSEHWTPLVCKSEPSKETLL